MKKTVLLFIAIAFITLFPGGILFASNDVVNPLEPVKTDNPQYTMRTFMESMDKYKTAKENRNSLFNSYLDMAVRCLDLSDFSFVEQQQRGREAAILLKEVIDRVIVIDYEKIPGKNDVAEEKLLRWRLKSTEIVISMQESGDRAGEYLFSSDTTMRTREFYNKVKHLPYKDGTGQGALYKDAWFEENVPLWMKEQVFYLYIWQWVGLFLAILAGLILKVLIKVFVDFLNVIFQKKSGVWLKKLVAAFPGPSGWIGAILFWYIAFYFMSFEGVVLTLFNVALKISLSGVLLWLIYRLLNVLSDYLIYLASKTESTLDDQLVPLLNKAMKIFVIIFGVLIIIQNLGVNVVSVLAGLGIGGFAIAFAAKDMVANFFGSLMILFDSPFQVGDWIVVGQAEGTVEEIGFRSTKIRTFYNSLIAVPNADLATKEVDNMGRREYRRVREVIGITLDTPPEKVEAFLEGIKNIVKSNEYTRKDYYHIVFTGYGSSSLNILIYLFLKVPDWSAELLEKQNILLEILRLAKALNVNFALPAQTLHIDSSSTQDKAEGKSAYDLEQIKKAAAGFAPGGDFSKPSGLGIYTPSFKEKD